MPGVHCVITGQDIPRVTYGNWRLFPGTQDEYALAMDKVRFIGDEVAAVAAVDRETAEEPPSKKSTSNTKNFPASSMWPPHWPGAPVIHDTSPSNISIDRKIAYGDIEAGFAASDYVREDTFTVHAVSHAYMEPCACVAQSDPDDRITLWTSTQTPYIVQCLLASTLNMRENDIRVIKPNVGGGFGGKMELRPWEFCAAFMARRTGRPVKFTLTREEELALRTPAPPHDRPLQGGF
jgi:CO/xanthine dehydrogenase Mo-binding subunit